MRKWLLTIALLCCTLALPAQEIERTRLLLLLDCSASMWDHWQSAPKIKITQQVLLSFLENVGNNNNVDVALRVFGHMNKDAFGTRLEVPFGENNGYQLQSKIKTLVPNGGCTVATALTDALTDFPASDASRNIILIITDGMDDRDAEICNVARQVELSGVVVQTFVIGIGGGEFGGRECAGSFFEVPNEEGYAKMLHDIFYLSDHKTPVVVHIEDSDGNTYPTEVPLVVSDHRTGVCLQTTLYSIDQRLKPDTLWLDPLMVYDFTLLTHPPLRIENRRPASDQIDHLVFRANQGDLQLQWSGPSGQWTEAECDALVRRTDTPNHTKRQSIGSTANYLAGEYDIEVQTTPITTLRHVQVANGVRTDIRIPRPGQLILSKPKGITTGCIIMLRDGEAIPVADLTPSRAAERLMLQPGQYEVVLRPSRTTDYASVRSVRFIIESGKTTKIEM